MVIIGVLAFIPSLRQRALLEMALESLATQTGAPEFQILLIDNGNFGPNDSAWLEELANKFGARYMRRLDSEIAAARDFVIRCESEYVGFVDSDVQLPRDWLARMVSELETSRTLVAVGSSNRPPTKESEFEEVLRVCVQVPWNFLGSAQVRQQNGNGIAVSHLSSCAVLYRAHSILQAGGYDLRFTQVCEDLELSSRLRKLGELRLIGDAPVIHRQDRDTRSWLNRIFRYGWGQIEVMRKHPREIFTLKAALVPMLLLTIALGIFAVLRSSAPFIMLLIAYFVPVAGGIFWCNQHEPLSLKARAIPLTIATHTAYVLGMTLGAIGLFRNPPSKSL